VIDEPERPLHSVLTEEALAAADEERVDHQAELVDEVVLEERVDELRAPDRVQRVAVLLLQRRYGRADVADSARARWLALVRRTYGATGRMMEKYDVVNVNRKAGGGEYPTQDGFGWTNGVALALCARPAQAGTCKN
jgi:hypothetical protein